MGDMNYAVNEDGTIVRNAYMDKEILETIEVSSYSHRMLAAYEARNLAYEVSKSQYGKANYKDYVEMLIRKNCPIEYEKAEIGKRYRLLTRLLTYTPFFFMFYIPFMIMLRRKHKSLCDKK